MIYSNSNARDLVFDPTRNQLYITTTGGTIERYDVSANKLLTPYGIPGASLIGADLTPDGSVLVVGDATYGATQGVIHRIDLPTGTNTNLTYNLASSERGSYDVVALTNSRVLFSASRGGTGSVPFREVNLSTNTVAIRPDLDDLSQDSWFSRNADYSRMIVGE